jgi:ferredoxin
MTPAGAVIDPEKCAGCGKCMDNCASEAIRKKEINNINGKE